MIPIGLILVFILAVMTAARKLNSPDYWDKAEGVVTIGVALWVGVAFGFLAVQGKL